MMALRPRDCLAGFLIPATGLWVSRPVSTAHRKRDITVPMKPARYDGDHPGLCDHLSTVLGVRLVGSTFLNAAENGTRYFLYPRRLSGLRRAEQSARNASTRAGRASPRVGVCSVGETGTATGGS